MQLDVRLWGKSQGLKKRSHPLVCHLLDTAAVCNVLWEQLLTGRQRHEIAKSLGVSAGDARTLASFWAGLHDLGKISVDFQFLKDKNAAALQAALASDPAYVFRPSSTDTMSHEEAALWTLVPLFDEVAQYPRTSPLPRKWPAYVIAQILAGHGGCYWRVPQPRELREGAEVRSSLGAGPGWREQRQAHFETVRRVTGATMAPSRAPSAQVAVQLTALVMVSDWLASATDEIEQRLPAEGWSGTREEIDAYWQVAQAAAPGLVDGAGLEALAFPEDVIRDSAGADGSSMAQLEPAVHLPKLVEEHGPGLVSIVASAGADRVTTALRAASVIGRAAGARGLFYALPSMAAVDTHVGAVRDFARRHWAGSASSLVLHSSARFHPATVTEQLWEMASAPFIGEEERWADTANSWLAHHDHALLAPLGIGTVDELLQGVLPLEHNAMRLFAMSGKVVVIDEAHACGPWGHRLMARFLEWMGSFGTPVVLATSMPGSDIDALVAAYRRGAGSEGGPGEPLSADGWLFATRDHLDVRPTGCCRTTGPLRISTAAPTAGAVRELLAPLVSTDSGSAVVYHSTAEEAQRAYLDLAAAFPELVARGDLHLLHTQFPNQERWRRLDGCLRRFGRSDRARRSGVLVTTPMLEHAHGLTFDLVVTDPAPIANLMLRGEQAWCASAGHGVVSGLAESRLVVLGAGDVCDVPPALSYDASLLQRAGAVLGSDRTIRDRAQAARLVEEAHGDAFLADLDRSAALELRRLDSLRESRQERRNAAAEWAEIPAPVDVRENLFLLSRSVPGMAPGLLGPGLGEDITHVLPLYEHPDDSGNRWSQYFDPDRVRKHDPKKDGAGDIVPYLVPVPRRLLGGVKRDRGNSRWRQRFGNRVFRLPVRMAKQGVWTAEGASRIRCVAGLGLTIDEFCEPSAPVHDVT